MVESGEEWAVGIPIPAWIVAHLGATALGDIDLSDVDSLVLEAVSNNSNLHYDLISGVVGLGVYGVERAETPKGQEIVRAAAERLSRSSHIMDTGCYWLTAPEYEFSNRKRESDKSFIDYGVAHGMSGIIAFLAMGRSRGLLSTEYEQLLSDSCRFIEAAGAWNNGYWSLPSTNLVGKNSIGRLAWCYNELGASSALLIASEALGDIGLQERVCSYLHGSLYHPDKVIPVVEPGLCHGAMGIALQYKAAAAVLADDALVNASYHWLKVGLEMRELGDGISGFSARILADRKGRTMAFATPSLLEGAAGIGLALLSLSSDVGMGWMRFMGLDFECSRR